jgi:hypothetical protein
LGVEMTQPPVKPIFDNPPFSAGILPAVPRASTPSARRARMPSVS